ncbi:MAG: hypothetical protein HYU46_03475, partial [Deltaproteobacteria bacterium]|nr:hypothetical protein [Deltaproteobacteria bacterium]
MNGEDGMEGSSELVAKGPAEAEVTERVRSVQQEVRAVRSRSWRRLRKITKLERTKNLHVVVVNLVNELRNEGFASLLCPPDAITLVGPEIEDPKTRGKIGHTQEPLGAYIQRLSVDDNFFQRPPFDHVTDPIYRRLIRDFIEGAVMPESKIAALSWSGGVRSLDDESVRYSIIDGLQRLYCFLIAILLVWRRDQLVQDAVIPEEAWNFFAGSVNRLGDPQSATEKLLERVIRYEIFYAISLAGLL